jgi:D-3-phosphoglycerate dehydrogenase / 2-oxoglutarate reductase
MGVTIDDRWCQEAIAKVKYIDQRVLVCSLDRRYTREECEKYDLIASCTTGLDHIDHGEVPIISLQGETEYLRGVYATAEHTMALILALARKIPAAFEDVLDGEWDREIFQGMELRGKTLGIIGLGRVGKQVAHIAFKGLEMKVDAYDPNDGLLYFRMFERTLEKSDIITVHVPLNDETTLMFRAEQFAMMKPGALFVNTSRGAVVDEYALLLALESKHLGGAALDVMADEPFVNKDILEYARTHDNLLLTPHLGGNTLESRQKCQLFIADKIKKHCSR